MKKCCILTVLLILSNQLSLYTSFSKHFCCSMENIQVGNPIIVVVMSFLSLNFSQSFAFVLLPLSHICRSKYTEQKKKHNTYIPLNFEQTMIQSEIIAFSTSSLDRLPKTDFYFDEYLRSYWMPTLGMLKVINHTVHMCKH